LPGNQAFSRLRTDSNKRRELIIKEVHIIFLTLNNGFTTHVTDATLKSNTHQDELVKPVKVIKGLYTLVNKDMNYIGIVSAKNPIIYSSKVPGQVSEIFVKAGQKIDIGQRLFQIDSSNLNLKIEASKITVDKSYNLLEKTSADLNYLKENLEKMRQLSENGTVSKSTFEEIAIKYKHTLTNFKNAEYDLKLAKLDLEKNTNTLNDTVTTAKKEGTVIKINTHVGELIHSSLPAVMVIDTNKIINVGIAFRELRTIKEGMHVKVMLSDKEIKGTIDQIDAQPDRMTGLYNVEITFKDPSCRLGEIVHVLITLERQKGIQIPISAIGTGEYDFVFIEKEKKAVKKKIEIIGIYKDFILIKHIDDGANIIVEGMKNISEGDLVKINQ